MCTEVETVQSKMNLVKHKVAAFILIMYFFAQPTPSSGPKPNFTRFDIELRRTKDITIIKVDNTLGLYVDENDGWKVKATTDQNKWNAFKIGNFHPQYPSKQPSENGTQRSIFHV